MATIQVSISPVWNGAQFFDNDGLPLNGGKLYQYEAGSFNTEQTTYTDNQALVANPNPIVLDSSGRLLNDLWLVNGLAYNLVIKSSTDIVLDAIDNVIGVVPSSTGGAATAIWNPIASPPTYVSPTQFLVPENVLHNFRVANRVRIQFNDDTFKYGTVSASSFVSPNTQVTIVPDQGDALNSGMVNLFYSAAVSDGSIVDAGAVAYNAGISYPGTNTVGLTLQTLTGSSSLSTATTTSIQTVYLTGGSSTNFTVSPNPAFTAANQRIAVRFHVGSTGGCTLNISSLGNVPLYQYNSGGGYAFPVIAAGQVSEIMYNGTYFILCDQLPLAPPVVGRPETQYVNVDIPEGGTYGLPANTTGIFLYSEVDGSDSRGGITGIEVYDASNNNIGSMYLSGTNVGPGPDGKSGMRDGVGGWMPISTNGNYFKCVRFSGTSVRINFRLMAITTFA